MISAVKRYTDLLRWLFADIWSCCRGLMLAVYGLDVLGLSTMAGAYGMGRKILGQVNGHAGSVRLWGYELSVLGAIGIAAGLILVALLAQSGARLASHRLALALVSRYEASSVFKIWSKVAEIAKRGEQTASLPDAGWIHQMVTRNGRALGTAARLAVMAISGSLTAFFFAALAIYSAPRMALIFTAIGVGTFGFMLRNNRRAALASRRSREFALQARVETKQLFKEFGRDNDSALVEAGLHRLYDGGLAARATEANSEQLYRVYQSQFLMSAGAAFAIALALLLPLMERPKGGAAVPVAMTAAGLVLLKHAFGYAGSVAGHLTRLNLRHQQLVEHRCFLNTGQLPKILSQDGGDEDAEAAEE